MISENRNDFLGELEDKQHRNYQECFDSHSHAHRLGETGSHLKKGEDFIRDV